MPSQRCHKGVTSVTNAVFGQRAAERAPWSMNYESWAVGRAPWCYVYTFFMGFLQSRVVRMKQKNPMREQRIGFRVARGVSRCIWFPTIKRDFASLSHDGFSDSKRCLSISDPQRPALILFISTDNKGLVEAG